MKNLAINLEPIMLAVLSIDSKAKCLMLFPTRIVADFTKCHQM